MRQESPYADQQAIAFQKGEEKGLAFFFNELYPALCIYANYYTDNEGAAQEIASEAFLKPWQKRSEFGRAGSIRAFLYTIVRLEAINWRKKDQRITNGFKKQNDETKEVDSNTPFANLVRVETVRHLHKAIGVLPPECRKIFQLLYIEGKTVTETADLLHLSPSTVKTQKKRGLEALRKQFIFHFLFLFAVFVQKIMINL